MHVALFLFAWLGIPVSYPEIVPMQVIEVALETESTKVEPVKPAPAPEPEKAPPAPPPPAPEPPQPVTPPEPVVTPEPKPELEPVPEPKPEVAEIPIPKVKPEPKPEPPKAVESPRPKAKPTPKPKPQVAEKPAPTPKPEPEAKPNNDFASVLKTVSKLEKQAPKPEKKPEKTLQEQVAEALSRNSNPAPQPLTQAISASDLDAIRRQIEACWNLPAGARDAQNMIVGVRTLMNPDGRVRSASIVDTARAASDPFYRSMAESARRAVLNPRCQPLRLPPEKYDEWRVMFLNFDPRGMF